MFLRTFIATALATLMASGCSDAEPLRLGLGYDEPGSRLLVTVTRGLESGEALHVRVRQGQVGELDCSTMAGDLERFDDQEVSGQELPTFRGPLVEDSMFEPTYDTSWLEMPEPTQAMLDSIVNGEFVVDACLMNGDTVVAAREWDIRSALDEAGADGKFDGEGEDRIESVPAYAEACVAEMGEIPFFEPLGDGDYSTYNCLDSVPIPTTVTDAETGLVEYPNTEVNQCDNPQYIYSSCEPNAVDGRTNGPRVASRVNDQGTQWVLLCRKSKEEEGSYNDIAMIGHNSLTGATCYFQNALYSRTDGLAVPHPGDRVQSETSAAQSETLWSGIQGGVCDGSTEDCTSNIECAKCHDSDAFIHTPWIDQALNEEGEPVIPKMGVTDDYFLGANDTPYYLINQEGQGWSLPRSLVSEEAGACTSCHRIGGGRWATDWIDRLAGDDGGWDRIVTAEYLKFEHRYWMPTDLEGLGEDNWEESEYAKAMDFIRTCGTNPDAEGCEWEDVPREPLLVDGELPAVELEGADLALEALKVLGAPVTDPTDDRCDGPDGSCETRRCAECHAVSRSGLRNWDRLTDRALSDCNLGANPDDMTQAEARESVNCMRTDRDNPESVFAAEHLGILTTGVWFTHFRKLFQKAYSESTCGDLPTAVRVANEATLEQLDKDISLDSRAAANIVDARPFATIEELLAVSYVGQSAVAKLDAFGLEGFASECGSGNAWLVEYLRFRNRVSMPKGSHPNFTQFEYAVLLKWFDSNLTDLDDVLVDPPAPATCEENFDSGFLSAHAERMQFEGWGAINEDNGIRMHGCPSGDDDALNCLQDTQYPDRTDEWGTGRGVIREVTALNFNTSFWTRTSADGRFIGNGGSSGSGGSSTITDLARGIDIGIDASYDPGFFADNSGFIFQGGGAGICAQSLLETADRVTFDEPSCIRASGINLYQHVARALGGGDYFIINSQFTSDSGGASSDPSAGFNFSSTMKFHPMIFNGTTYEQRDPVIVNSPFEGDSVLSPSAELVISRLAGQEGSSLGYVVREVTATPFGDTYRIGIDREVARSCVLGAKANISFDERFYVTHHYEDNGAANIVLVDMLGGEQYILTDVPDGTQALFPHFISNGWFYFLVNGPDGEYIGASDAAVRLAAGMTL